MDIQSWLSIAESRIQSDSPTLDAELLLAEHLGKSRAYLFAFADEVLSDELQARLAGDIEQLANGYPLAYLLGKKAFWDMQLTVTPDTLIPRADTELLIELMLDLFPKNYTGNFIDLGTGTGAIAIALSREFPLATMTATDFSDKALKIAKANAADWQKSPITFVETSWLSGFAPQSFDAIVSNPPYIEENDEHLAALRHEPITALTAPEQGLADIRMIIKQAQTCLKPNGYLLLEHGYNQGKAVRQLFQNANWHDIATHQDLGGNDRVTLVSAANPEVEKNI